MIVVGSVMGHVTDRATMVGEDLPREVVTTVELELKYEGYFAKEREAASIPGVSPADLQNLVLEIERSRAS